MRVSCPPETVNLNCSHVAGISGFDGADVYLSGDRSSLQMEPQDAMAQKMCSIQLLAWILTRYNVRRDTRMTPYEKLRGQKYRKERDPATG